MDPKTRLLLYKMVNAGVLENINGCVSTGKESVVFHANGGRYVVIMLNRLCFIPNVTVLEGSVCFFIYTWVKD